MGHFYTTLFLLGGRGGFCFFFFLICLAQNFFLDDPFTDILFTATSSHNAAALGRGTPGYDGLVTIVGLSVAFTMSGGLLFWL